MNDERAVAETPRAVRAIARRERGWFRERRVLEFDLRYDDGRVERVDDLWPALRGLHTTDISTTRQFAVEACPEVGTGEWVHWG